jgi:hypothetical protein
LIEIVSLLGLYAFGNCWFIKEMGAELMGARAAGELIFAGWIFWLTTMLIPVLYVWIGIKNKDRVLIRAGLLLIALMFISFRYYYPFASVAGTMALAGGLLIMLSWVFSRYLSTPKNGFVAYQTVADPAVQIESLVIAQTFTPAPVNDRFGGGSFGGGGASGDY